MNAKELRQTAAYIVEQWDNHDKFRMVEGDEAFMNADGEPDAVTFARHILATVREDDDELVTYEWLCSTKTPYMENRKIWWNFDGYAVSLSSSGARFHCNHMPIASVQTRGRFRSLCKGLGIELKEKAC
jgi:hypothetical protein